MRAARKRNKKYTDNDSDLDEYLEPVSESASSSGGGKREETADEGAPLVVEKILGRKFLEDSEGASGFSEMYLIKWRGMSYIHVSWELKHDIERVDPQGKVKIKRFLQSPLPPLIFGDPSTAEGSGNDGGAEEDVEYFNPEYAEIHRIISCDTPDTPHSICNTIAGLDSMVDDPKNDTENDILYYVKWRGLPYNECSWERWGDIKYYTHEVFAFWQRQRPPKLSSLSVKHPSLQEYAPLVKSPVFGVKASESSNSGGSSSGEVVRGEEEVGLTMREYQLEGVNWLLWNWWHKRPCILADEMGLGKTIQSVCFLHQLRTMTTTQCSGPFLVVAPLSLIAQWQSEIALWSPDMNCVVMHGSQQARDIILSYEFYHHEAFTPKADVVALRKRNACKFDILLTTYEICMKDIKIFTKIDWKVLIVDEAHRLKNHQARLFEVMMTIPRQQCVLLTGTPLQNKTEELWALLHFADPSRFNNQQEFVQRFGDLRDASDVANLHSVLKPYLLRRVKEDVEKAMPPKEEVIVEVTLTAFQKQFYRAIYEKNVQYLFRGAKASNTPSLMNVMMELRKCCNHPYLIRGVEERLISEMPIDEQTDATLHQKLVDCSGKFVLLDKLLPRLKDEGRKVLIFSQMVKVLNLLEDYMRFKKYLYERLDGSTRSTDRNMAVERFCRPSLKRFVMILSTKAGGLGLNLTAADTVIIFDSDWNPHNDMQAQARAHRIGQTKAVKVYRLLTRKTYEMHMFHKASMKLGLDKAVLAHARNEQEAGEDHTSSLEDPNKLNLQAKEIDELLKRGAYDIFRDDDTEATEFVEADIDSILDRQAHVVSMDHVNANSMSSSLGGFSKASFISADESEDIDIEDPDFWKKAVGFEEPPPQEEEVDPFIENLPNQRKRKQTQVFGDNDVDERELEDLLRIQPVEPEKPEEKKEEKTKEKSKVVKEAKPKKERVKKEVVVKVKVKKEKAMKPLKEPKEPKEHKDPKAWGPHARDRMLRALLQFGFGRWKKIRTESGANHRELKDIEGFSRSYMLQCGLCAGAGDSVRGGEGDDKERGGKLDSQFIDDAVNAAQQIDEMVQRGEVQMSVLIPSILQDPKFVGKLKSGDSRKMLNKLDQLTRLFGIVGEAVEEYCNVKNPDIDKNGDLDFIIGQIKDSRGLADHLPLGDVRPPWTRPRSWWDEDCDKQLLIGVFEHGHGKYTEIRDDANFVFLERMKAAAERAKVIVQPESKGYPVMTKLINRVLNMSSISKNKYQDVMNDDVISTILTIGKNRKCRIKIATVRYSQYRGVYSQPGSTKWMAQYGNNAKSSYIGSFDTEREAALAYDALAKKLEGTIEGCNFDCSGCMPPSSSTENPSDSSMDQSAVVAPEETFLETFAAASSNAGGDNGQAGGGQGPIRQMAVTPFARDESPPLPWHRASRYRGVRASGAKWTAQICYEGVNHHLGTFSGEYQAAQSYDASAIKHHGDVAVLNFPRGIEEELLKLVGVEGVEIEYIEASSALTGEEGECVIEGTDNIEKGAKEKQSSVSPAKETFAQVKVERDDAEKKGHEEETEKPAGKKARKDSPDKSLGSQPLPQSLEKLDEESAGIDKAVSSNKSPTQKEVEERKGEVAVVAVPTLPTEDTAASQVELLPVMPSQSPHGSASPSVQKSGHSSPSSLLVSSSETNSPIKSQVDLLKSPSVASSLAGSPAVVMTIEEKEKLNSDKNVDNDAEDELEDNDNNEDDDDDENDNDDDQDKEKKIRKDAGLSLLTTEEEKLRADMLMPESRVLNRLFVWLVTSPVARQSRAALDALKEEQRKTTIEGKKSGRRGKKNVSRDSSSVSNEAFSGETDQSTGKEELITSTVSTTASDITACTDVSPPLKKTRRKRKKVEEGEAEGEVTEGGAEATVAVGKRGAGKGGGRGRGRGGGRGGRGAGGGKATPIKTPVVTLSEKEILVMHHDLFEFGSHNFSEKSSLLQMCEAVLRRKYSPMMKNPVDTTAIKLDNICDSGSISSQSVSSFSISSPQATFAGEGGDASITKEETQRLCAAFLLFAAPFKDVNLPVYSADVCSLLGTGSVEHCIFDLTSVSKLVSEVSEEGVKTKQEKEEVEGDTSMEISKTEIKTEAGTKTETEAGAVTQVSKCDTSITTTSSLSQLESFEWTHLVQVAGVQDTVTPQQAQDFFNQTWLPFCVKISSVSVSEFTNQRILPEPLVDITSHSPATQNLCSLFMQRQRMLHAIRFILCRYPAGMRTFLREHAGTYTIGMPVWWCPWIHDIALMVGCLKHGYLNLEKILTDEESPFFFENLEQHIYRVFVYGTATHAPAAAGVFSSPEEAREWVSKATLVFPLPYELENHLMQVLSELTKHLAARHLYRIYNVQESPVPSVPTSTTTESTGPAADTNILIKTEDSTNNIRKAVKLAAFDSGHGLTEWGIRLPIAPLALFAQQSAKRRRVALKDHLMQSAAAPPPHAPKKKNQKKKTTTKEEHVGAIVAGRGATVNTVKLSSSTTPTSSNSDMTRAADLLAISDAGESGTGASSSLELMEVSAS